MFIEELVDDSDGEDEELAEASLNQARRELDTNKLEEVPAKEPRFNAQPGKSALKKMKNGEMGTGSGPSTPKLENKLRNKQEPHSK